MDGTSLFLGVILGSIGTGYFLYGRKQRKGSAMISGFLLCGLPWFISNNLLLTAAGVLVAAVPFFVEF